MDLMLLTAYIFFTVWILI